MIKNIFKELALILFFLSWVRLIREEYLLTLEFILVLKIIFVGYF